VSGTARPARRLAHALLVVVTLIAVVTTGGTLPAGAAEATGAAEAAGAAGWRLTFSTDFSGSSLPTRCGTYSGEYPGGASYWLDDEVSVSGGLLRVGIQRREHAGRQYTSGGVTCYGLPQTYGKYEWRAKVPLGRGIDSYATLWPTTSAPNQAAFVEILAAPGAEVMAVTNEYGSGRARGRINGRYSDAFHTYAMEWTPTRFRLLVDGVQRFDSPHAATVTRTIGFSTVSGDEFAGLPDAATILPAEFQVDWLRVYAYVAGAAPTPGATTATSKAAPPQASRTARAAATATPPGAAVSASQPPPGTDSLAAVNRAGRFTPGGTPWAWWAVGALAVVLAGGVLRVLRRRRG